MLRVNVQRTGYVGWLAVGTALLLVGTLATASAQAGFVGADGTVFTDDFSGTHSAVASGDAWGTLTTDTYTWNAYKGVGGSLVSTSGGALTLSAAAAAVIIGQDGQLSALGSSTDWAAETEFTMGANVGGYNGSGSDGRQWAIMIGLASWTDRGTGKGIDIRALPVDATHFRLGWGGYQSDGVGQESILFGSNLNSGQTYHLVAHVKSDSTVDVYLDGSLISNQAVIGSGNPGSLLLGLSSPAGNGTLMLTDYVKVGEFVIPAPSTVVLLGTGLLGLLACAWRKRK